MPLPATRSVQSVTPAAGPLDVAYEAAQVGAPLARAFIADPANRNEIERALRIRAVETALINLFGKGRLHGTIHTCVGQEFSGALLGKHLREGDFVTSNHRCHGHFIAATGDWRGLVDEIVGNRDGVCAGVGSSQHLCAPNFISNGQQGGLLPVAAGVALDRKARGARQAVISFIGEGTLGEGIVYETLNLDGLWKLPHVIVCENNFYSQSTPQQNSVAGQIAARAAAFGAQVFTADTWDLPKLDIVLESAIGLAREACEPAFLLLSTYRLNPHSKGDDSRERDEIEYFRSMDPASLAAEQFPAFARLYAEIEAEVAAYIEEALAKPPLEPALYFADQLPATPPTTQWRPQRAAADDQRVVQQLNRFYRERLEENPDVFFLGEDVADPYGGAFKISKGFTTDFPERVLTTPISEAAITGVGVGLAICGRRPLVEIMFGDFITYAFDQIVNNAAKVHHMYNRQLSCPVVVRTPMGGRRGYGPTHSQSLERFLVGIENCCAISLNSLAPVADQLAHLGKLQGPAILFENKSDYAQRVFAPPDGFDVERDDAPLPTFRIRPRGTAATVTLVAYGGMARFVADNLVEIFERTDFVPELIVPTGLHPLNLAPIAEAARAAGFLVVAEEGPGFASVGAELIAGLAEAGVGAVAGRVSGRAVPVPSAPSLEAATLPGVDEICAAVTRLGAQVR